MSAAITPIPAHDTAAREKAWAKHPGVFITDMPESKYHGHPDSISKSGLDLIARSPAHYYYAPPKERTRHMAIGTAIHCALLEPERFAAEYVLLRNVKDRRASEYKEAVKTHPADVVLVSHEADHVAGMQESVYAQPAARRVLEADGWRELSAFAQDLETGSVVRCRYDLLTADGKALDLKKTQDARPEAFAKSVYQYRYHVQAALYSDVYYWITGEKLAAYAFLAVEEQPPHAACIYVLDDYDMQLGREQYRRDLNTYAACVESGEWPTYDGEPQVIALPEWARRKIEEHY